MRYTVDLDDGVKILHLQGPMDLSQAAALRKVLSAEIDGSSARVLVDLSDVPLIDSSGIGAMVAAQCRADVAGGAFALAAAGPTVARVFTVTPNGGLLRLYTTVEEGVEALRAA
jgi:anti-sigma B factor antagonist